MQLVFQYNGRKHGYHSRHFLTGNQSVLISLVELFHLRTDIEQVSVKLIQLGWSPSNIFHIHIRDISPGMCILPGCPHLGVDAFQIESVEANRKASGPICKHLFGTGTSIFFLILIPTFNMSILITI